MLRRLVGLFLVFLLSWGGLGWLIFRDITPKLGLDLQGGTSVILTAPEGTDSEVLDIAVDIMRQRIEDVGGVAEPEIQVSGGNTVLVQLPGVTDERRALEAIGTTGQLSFRPVLTGWENTSVSPYASTTTTLPTDGEDPPFQISPEGREEVPEFQISPEEQDEVPEFRISPEEPEPAPPFQISPESSDDTPISDQDSEEPAVEDSTTSDDNAEDEGENDQPASEDDSGSVNPDLVGGLGLGGVPGIFGSSTANPSLAASASLASLGPFLPPAQTTGTDDQPGSDTDTVTNTDIDSNQTEPFDPDAPIPTEPDQGTGGSPPSGEPPLPEPIDTIVEEPAPPDTPTDTVSSDADATDASPGDDPVDSTSVDNAEVPVVPEPDTLPPSEPGSGTGEDSPPITVTIPIDDLNQTGDEPIQIEIPTEEDAAPVPINEDVPPGLNPDNGLTIDDDVNSEAYLFDPRGFRVLHLGPAALLGTDISSAIASPPGGVHGGFEWAVNLSLNSEGADAFAEVTGEAAQHPVEDPRRSVAIVLDGGILFAPEVSPSVQAGEGITGGDAVITVGNFEGAEEQAKDLATILRYGSLPVDFERSQVMKVSATLGSDSLQTGLVAGLAGLILVALVLLFYYRILGLVALVGLTVFGSALIALFSWLGLVLGVTLTLAGVTGIIVAIGITADSYIVYFERIKDEIRAGRTVDTAVTNGFKSAYRTILTADAVSLLGAGLLWILAIGPVRGFALSLGIATILDLIVARMYTRRAAWVISRTRLGKGKRLGIGARWAPTASSAEPHLAGETGR